MFLKKSNEVLIVATDKDNEKLVNTRLKLLNILNVNFGPTAGASITQLR